MPKTVLIVEDEFLIAMDLQMVLEKHGWEVIGPVGTVAQALDLLAKLRPMVAVLDVTLHDGPVTRVAEALRAQNIPFIVASAYDKPETVAGDVLKGAVNVDKPTEERDLLKGLAAVADF